MLDLQTNILFAEFDYFEFKQYESGTVIMKSDSDTDQDLGLSWTNWQYTNVVPTNLWRSLMTLARQSY